MTDNTIPIDLPKSDDSRAVSPVIGVILMVAITIILAAVIGAFVLGFSTDTETPPSASWTTSQDTTDPGDITVTFTHNGGDNVDGEKLTVTSTGDEEVELEDDNLGTISAGDTVDVTLTDDSGDDDGASIRLVWESGDQSQTLATHTLSVEETNDGT